MKHKQRKRLILSHFCTLSYSLLDVLPEVDYIGKIRGFQPICVSIVLPAVYWMCMPWAGHTALFQRETHTVHSEKYSASFACSKRAMKGDAWDLILRPSLMKLFTAFPVPQACSDDAGSSEQLRKILEVFPHSCWDHDGLPVGECCRVKALAELSGPFDLRFTHDSSP